MPGMLSSFFFTGAGAPLSLVLFPGEPTVDYFPFPYSSGTIEEFVEPSGGTPPYVYDATYVSGSTEITAGDVGTAVVSFFATGDGFGINMKEAIWNFKVTDAALTEISQNCTIRFIFGTDPP
jgi:hypothetical protein